MCGASPLSPRRQAGFTMLELTITMLILTGITLLVERTLSVTHDTDRHLDARQQAQQRGAEILFEVQRGVASSRRLFGRGELGDGYAASLDLSRRPPVGTVRLPRPEASGLLAPDAPGEPRTGNALLFVREVEPIACPAGSGTLFVDAYRFVCWYPHASGRNLVGDDAQDALDLCVWRSVPYPSYVQLAGIEDDGDREQVVQHLHDALGYRYAWDPNEAAEHAFHALCPGGAIAAFATTPFRIEEDANRSEGGRLVYADVQLARTDPASVVKRAVLTADAAGSWVPDGFEVKVSGPSGHRRVWIHLVVEAPAGRSRTAAWASTLVAAARDR